MSKLRPEEHKEKATAFAKTRKRGTVKTSEFQKEYDLLRHFGITLANYNELLAKQHGVCAICGNPESIIDNRTKKPRQLAVDHCHKTHKVRGLLCMGCNQGIGNFRENIDYMAKAISYVINNGP
jgi:hypothetical protein